MKKLIRIEESIASLLIIAVSLLTILQVVARHLVSIPVPWIDETTRYLMIFMIYIAAASAVYRREHFNVELLDLFFNKKKMRMVHISHQVIITLFMVLFVYYTIQFVINQVNVGQLSPTLQISMGWPMSALVIGGLLMIIGGVGSIFNILQVRKEDK